MVHRRVQARQFVTLTLTISALTLGLSGCDDGGQLTIMPQSTPLATSTPSEPSVTSAAPASVPKHTSASAPTHTSASVPKHTSASVPTHTKRARRKSTGGGSVTCTNTNMRTTVTAVAQPMNHLLITGTNNGSKPCYAYSAPTISFDLSKDLTIDVLTDSTPQAVVWLEPGESAYAAVITSDGSKPASDNSYTAKKMALWFAAKGSDEQAGPGRSIRLQGEGVYIDETVAQVTYWQSKMDSALLW
jgi:hypothetical protein